MIRSVKSANEIVYNLGKQEGIPGKVGTTMVAAVIKEGFLYWISVGDSRIFLYRNGKLNQLTRDHIYANKLEDDLKKGLITKKEALKPKHRGSLTSYLGLKEINKINISDEPIKLQSGDRVILSSDGLFKTLDDNEIVAELNNHPFKSAKKLIEKTLAKNKKNQDNITLTILAYK